MAKTRRGEANVGATRGERGSPQARWLMKGARLLKIGDVPLFAEVLGQGYPLEVFMRKRVQSPTRGEWPKDSIWIITALFATTFLHHVYGGFRYKSDKRVKLSFIFVALFALTVLFYRMGRRHPWAQHIYKGIAWVAWVGVVGVFEGGYSHLVKVVLWLAKVPPAKLEKLFPPNEYVLPDDIFFEASGILTFAIGMWLAVRML